MMAESVKSLPKELLDNIDLQMVNVFTREGLDRQKELHVIRIPTITVNNMLAVETMIPVEDELIEIMHDFLEEFDKNNLV